MNQGSKRHNPFDLPSAPRAAVPPPPPPPPPPSAGSGIAPAVKIQRNTPFDGTNLSTLRGKRLGEILVAMGLINRPQLSSFEQEASLAKEFLGKFLIRRGLINPDQLCNALAIQANLPVVSLADSNVPVAKKYCHLIDLMRRCEIVPFSETEQIIFIAAKRALAPHRVGEVAASFGKDIKLGLAPDYQIENVHEALSPSKTQRRKNHRVKMAMPVWFRMCGPRGENPTPLLGGNTVDLSLDGIRLEVPESVLGLLADARRRDAFMQIRFSMPPYEVDGIYSVRYLHRKENKKAIEKLCILGLQLANMGQRERDNLKVTFDRAVISAKRLEDEFGTSQ